MIDRLRNRVAEFAGYRVEANAERERGAEDPLERAFFARRADFWHDVQCFADRIDTWRNLRRRHRAAAPLMAPIEVSEPASISNPVVVFMLIMLGFFVISFIMPFVLPKPGHAAEAGQHNDPARAAWFSSLKQPGTNISCCDISDCRKTKAEWKGNGWLAEVAMPDGTMKWSPVPASKVLHQPHSIDGEAYLCQSAGNVAGQSYANGIGPVNRSASDPTIYCFIPPDMGS